MKPHLGQKFIGRDGTVWVIDYFSDDGIDPDDPSFDPDYFFVEIGPIGPDGTLQTERLEELDDPAAFDAFTLKQGLRKCENSE